MKERLTGLDLLRGLIIVLMIFINLFDETAKEALVYSERGRAIDLAVTSLVPSVFVFLMGFFLIVSDGFSTKKLLRKSALLLILGYALNIVRYPLFMYLAGYSPSFGEAFAANSYYVHMVDIYIFAGYACLLLIPFSLVPPITAKAYTSFAAFVMYLTTEPQTVRELLQMLPSAISGYATHLALPIAGNVYFPFIPWFSYILLGIACGLFYKTIDKNSFFQKLTLYGMLTAFAGYMIFTKEHSVASFKMRADFYQHDYTVGIMLMGLTLILPVLAEFFLVKLPQPLRAVLTLTSKNVMLMYCLSWLITSYLKFVEGWSNHLDLQQSIMYALLIYAFCLLIAKLKDMASRSKAI